MRTIIGKPEQTQLPAETGRRASIARLTKQIYVLPSGRILKVVVDNDSELAASGAGAP